MAVLGVAVTLLVSYGDAKAAPALAEGEIPTPLTLRADGEKELLGKH